MSQPIAADDLEAATTERASTFTSAFESEAGFRAFYDQALPRVYGYLVGRCGGDRSAAEELTQETFIAAIRERRAFDGRSDPMTWLIGIARHKLADQFRRLDRDERRRLRLVVRELQVDPEGGAWRSIDDRAEIVRVLGTLSTLQRAVLVLHYGDGLPIREVARRLGKSESAAESLMTRAREAFRSAYRETPR